MRPLTSLFVRDLRLAIRVGGGGGIGVLFFLIVVVLTPFAIVRSPSLTVNTPFAEPSWSSAPPSIAANVEELASVTS